MQTDMCRHSDSLTLFPRAVGDLRVCVLSALTGEFLYESTHPWLEQVRVFLVKNGCELKVELLFPSLYYVPYTLPA